jgi:peptide/nickel transport system permease protein
MKYIIGRFLQIIPVLFLATFIIFFAIRLAPGDPAMIKLGPRGGSDPLALEQVRHEMGLDKPILVQYGIWMNDALRGDFGKSLLNDVPALQVVKGRVPASLQLILTSLTFAVIVAILLGVSAALKPGSMRDQNISTIATGLVSVPTFWVALLLLTVLSVKFRLLPASGYVRFRENPGLNLQLLIMPAISLAMVEVGVFTRFIRSSMIEVLGSNYIRTAKAKGISKGRVYFLHAFKNILVTLITVIGLEIGTLIGGTLLIEQIFGWSGIGWLLYQSIVNRDYAIVQCIIFFVIIVFVLINLIVDVLYVLIDPRVEL